MISSRKKIEWQERGRQGQKLSLKFEEDIGKDTESGRK